MIDARHNHLSRALRGLHRELLQAVKRDYELLHGRVDDAHALFRLADEDALFAWLKPLTAALAELDDALEDRESPVRAELALRQVRRLVGDVDGEFGTLLRQHLQASPEVAVAQGGVRSALRSLEVRAVA